MNVDCFIPWTPQDHFRFCSDERLRVVTVLLLQRRTRFVSKDVLINMILLMAIGTVYLPLYRVLNLPFDSDAEDVRRAFGRWQMRHVLIALRKTGRSMGYGFIQFARREDFDNWLAEPMSTTSMVVGGRNLVCVPDMQARKDNLRNLLEDPI